jgi:opacity protein-like surface antigen
MGILKTLAMSGAIVLSLLGAARAADMAAMPEIPSVDGANAVEPELGTNWYLRGDVSYKVGNDEIDAFGVGFSFPSAIVDSDWTAGIGIGYDFGWMRADVTADYLFNNNDINIQSYSCGSGGDCRADETTVGQSVVALFNTYFDLGTWNGFTPYVGAGVGIYSQLTNNDGQVFCAATAPNTCPVPFPATGGQLRLVSLDKGRTEFAYALMAGASYAINQNLAIDAGYRYLWIHDGQTVMNASTGEITHENHHVNEVRLGFRWMID